MDATAQAEAYASADFEAPNTAFIGHVEAALDDHRVSGRVLDLGCGPADICVRLARAHPAATIDALDGAAAMLACARQRLARTPDVGARIRLIHQTLPTMALEPRHYDLIISNSLLHHLHEPAVLWQCIRQVAKPGAAIVVMDLHRPASVAAASAIVARYAADEPALLRNDFHNSLLAAFTLEEVRAQLRAAGLEQLASHKVSDRHLLISGRMPDTPAA